MSDSYVYMFSDPKDSTPRHVGKGVRDRALVHLKRCHNARLRNMIDKRLREDFEVKHEVICSGLSDKAALAVEIFWIAVFGRLQKGLGPLFNATDGGEGGKGVVKKTQKAWNKDKKMDLPSPLVGCKLTPEAIKFRTSTRISNNGGVYSKGVPATLSTSVKASWEARRAKYGPSGRPEKETK